MLISIYQILLGLIGLLSLLVLIARSPVYSVIYLSTVYLIGGVIFILLDYYFMALTLIIVYVGAIAILFLFTILMINIRLTVQQQNIDPRPLVGLLILAICSYVINMSKINYSLIYTLNWSSLAFRTSDFYMLGFMIYKAYPLALILAGLLLLIVMVAIIKVHTSTR